LKFLDFGDEDGAADGDADGGGENCGSDGVRQGKERHEKGKKEY
jgi:hypothetical protein